DRSDLIDDDRFSTVEKLMANAAEGAKIVAAELAKRTLAEWTERFATLEGPWAPVQNALEVGHDPQLVANGMIADVLDADGEHRHLVASPVQFDEIPIEVR